MALLSGGTLNQDLEEPLATNHKESSHLVSGSIGEGVVHSHHHQAMSSVGSLMVVAVAEDGVIEAVQDPNHHWYVGVQWHPERTDDPHLGQGLFTKLVQACSQQKVEIQ